MKKEISHQRLKNLLTMITIFGFLLSLLLVFGGSKFFNAQFSVIFFLSLSIIVVFCMRYNQHLAWATKALFSTTILTAVIAAILLAFGRPRFLYTDYLFILLIYLLITGVFYIRSKEHLKRSWRQVFQNKMALSAAVILFFYLAIAFLDCIHLNELKPLPGVNDKDTKAQQVSSSNSGADKKINKFNRKYQAKLVSVLDIMLHPMRFAHDPITGGVARDPITGKRVAKDETTYSGPLAIVAYVKESTEGRDGKFTRTFPKLKYAGAHLEKADSRLGDIAVKSLVAVLAGIVIWVFLMMLLVLVLLLVRKENIITNTAKTVKKIFKGNESIPWHVALYTLLVLCIVATIMWYLSCYYYVLGTDKVGKDILYQGIKSIRTGVLIGTLATLIMLPFALFLGIAAGYFRGWIDDVIQFIYTTLSSIPSILLIAASVLAVQVYISNNLTDFPISEQKGDFKFLALCAILGITSWTGLCRILRGESLKLRELEYIQAAQALGVGHVKIIFRHISPNIMHIVMITIVLEFSSLVLAEAVLSYIGVGVDSSINSWGNMINSARLEMAREPVVWWALITALGFMFTLVLSANLFADAVRDAFDPRLTKG